MQFVVVIGLVVSCIVAPTQARVQFTFQGKLTGQGGKSIAFVVPASTSLLHRHDIPLDSVPSSEEQSKHPLYKIAAYNFANLPKLDVPENHLVVPSTNLLPSTFSDPAPEKEAKHGILYIQPLTSLDVNRDSVNPELLALRLKGNKNNSNHFVKSIIDRNNLGPGMNALNSSNQQKMANALPRFKVYQAVPDNIF